jgi:protein-disulfide isomerase
MKKVIGLMAVMAMMAGCNKVTSQDVEKILNDNPDIVFKVMENNPEKFIKSAQTAARKAHPQPGGEQDEQAQIEAEFKNPKVAEIQEARLVGPKDAPITIVEYTDLQCPFCARGAATLTELSKMYDGKVKLLIKHLPLPMHPQAKPAATYYQAVAMTAGEAKAHDWSFEIFKNQQKLQGPEADKVFDATAKALKIDLKKVHAAMKAKATEIEDQIQADTAEAQKFGFQGTPGFLINGVSLRGAYPLPMFKQIIDRHLSGGSKPGAAAQPETK